MLDYDENIAGCGEAVEDLYELFDVGDVQAGGGLVEHVDHAAGSLAGEPCGELDALGLAVGEGGGELTITTSNYESIKPTAEASKSRS